MAVTRIKNNQITDSTIVANAKVVDYSISASKLANNLTYGSNFTVSGNLTVNGTTTTVDTFNTLIQDPILVLADGQTSGSPTVDIGILGYRGSQNSSFIGWKESATTFMAILSNTTASNTTVNVTSYANFTASTITAQANLSVIGNIVGAANFSGNITGGNILTPGLISATANITGGNILTSGSGGAISGSGNITGGNILTGGLISATSTITSAANITGGNILTGGIVSAAGNIISGSGSFFIGNGSQLTGVSASTSGFPVSAGTSNIAAATNGNIGITVGGTSNVLTVTSTGIVTAGTSSASGNITGGNLLTGGLISATATITGGNLATGGTASATGNITGGNVLTGGLISATSTITSAANVIGGNLTTGGQVSATANITGGNVLTGGLVSATSNITGGNILTGGLISATSTITSAANVIGGNLTTAGQVSATANITGGNILTGGRVSATGDFVAGGNLSLAGNIVDSNSLTITTASGNLNLEPAGNIVLGNRYINGVQLTPQQNSDVASKYYVDLQASTALAFHQAVLAATNTTLATATGGTITYAQPNGASNGVGATLTTTGSFNLIDTANVQTVGTRILVKNEANAVFNGVYVWSNATVITRSTDCDEYGPNDAEQFSINDYFFVQGGNVNLGAAYVVDEPTGVITFGTSNIQFAQFSQAQIYSANTSAGLSLVGQTFSAKVDNNTTAFDLNGNISVKAGANLTTPNIGAATGTSLSVTGAINAGTTMSATGNVTGGNVLTGGLISATSTITSAANITGGNVLTGGLISSTGNVTGGNLLTGGLVSATGTITSAANITGGNVLTGGLISATSTITSAANVIGGNLTTGGQVSATANITGGNVLTGGLISAAGNITANPSSFFIGNGSQLTGVTATTSGFPVTAGTSNIAAATSGNIGITVAGASNVGLFTGSGLLVTGLISANGNVTGGNLNTAGLVTATGNITGGNILTGGLISATSTITSAANITGGNILTGGQVSATANVTGGNVLTGGLITATGNVTGANLILTSGFIDGPASGRITINGSDLDTDFAVDGDTAANVFYVDAGTGTASFGASTQITNAIVNFASTNSIKFPVGNTGQRPATGVTGMVRFNSTNNNLEVYDNSQWSAVGVPSFTVIADQQFNGDGATVAFTLSSTQTTNSCIVSINGVVQVPTVAYSVAGTNPSCVLTFTEAPASGDLIDVRQITTTTTVTSISNSSGNAVVAVSDTSNVVAITGSMSITGDLTVTGNATLSGNILGDRIQNGTTQIDIQTINGNANITVGGTSNVAVFASTGEYVTGLLSVTGNITGANLLTGGLISATGNLTVGGDLNLVGNVVDTGPMNLITSSNGNISLLPNGTGNVNTGANIMPTANATANIGSASFTYNTIFAKATSAQYADLAEKYTADAEYAPGTVVAFGGTAEVTLSIQDADRRVAGVVSTNPSYIMNGGLEGANIATVALTGRVPTKVTGTVAKGDLMVSNGDGTARAETDPRAGAIIGKALEDFAGTTGTIEVVIGRF